MKYVFLFFIPGAAGNFFSRCLNLLADTKCWGSKDGFPTSLKERIDLLTYQPVLNRTKINWTKDWETQISHYSKLAPAPASNTIMIFPQHPNTDVVGQVLGNNDGQFKIYIDPGDAFEWAVLNALYKDSYLTAHWLQAGEAIRQDEGTLKINLGSIIRSEEGFMLEFVRACNHIGLAPTDAEIEAVLNLYREWKTTTLPPEQFAEFKQQLGWRD